MVWHGLLVNPIFRNRSWPYCNSTGRLIPHDSYSRYMVTLKNNRIETVILRIPRVKCTSCGHTHAFLPEMLIPYSSYGLRFVLTVLKDYFLHMHTVEKICKIYQIAHSTLLEVERMYTDFYGLSFNLWQADGKREGCIESEDFREMTTRLEYLKEIRGIGVFTASPGMGKTFALRCFAKGLNPNLYQCSISLFINCKRTGILSTIMWGFRIGIWLW